MFLFFAVSYLGRLLSPIHIDNACAPTGYGSSMNGWWVSPRLPADAK